MPKDRYVKSKIILIPLDGLFALILAFSTKILLFKAFPNGLQKTDLFNS
jgi:hypothetical protein